MSVEASRRGYAFASVKPRGDRNFEAHTVSIVFAMEEGPRSYIERINVRGNTRTKRLTSSAVSSISPKAMLTIVRWSIALSAASRTSITSRASRSCPSPARRLTALF
jgi:hypothetical protein